MADIGHDETDDILKEMEKRVGDVYDQAVKDAQKKLDDYLARFAAKDKIKQEKLKNGEITQDEYARWRKGQMCIGQRWREMLDTLSSDFTNADKIAMSIVNGYSPEVYALNHNYATFQVEKDATVDTSYTLYDRQTVERLLREDQDLLPKAKVDIPKDKRWNRQHIQQQVTQGILQGEDIEKISKRLRTVTDMDRRAAIRNARTITTGAENAGRVDSYTRAVGMGIELEQEWLATLDGRTRHSHRMLDGESIKVGTKNTAKFSNGCRYPGDPEGPPWEVYNCRCTLVAKVKNIDQSNAPRNNKLGKITYEEWKNGKKPRAISSEVQPPKIPAIAPVVPVPTPMPAVAPAIPYRKIKLNQNDWEQWAVDPEPYQEALLDGKVPNYAGWGKISDDEKQRILEAAQQMQVDALTHKYNNVIEVYRGESFPSKEAAEQAYRQGATFTTNKLTSTATKRSIAEEYAEMGGGGDVKVVQVITNPGGVRGIMTDPMGIGGSDEIILPIGTTYKITGTTWDPDTNTLKVYMFAYPDDNKKLNASQALESLNKLKQQKVVFTEAQPYEIPPRTSTASTKTTAQDRVQAFNNVGGMTEEQVYNKLKGTGLNSTSYFQAYIDELDDYKLPVVVPTSKFEAVSKESQVFYRGLTSTEQKTAQEMIHQTLYENKYYTGNGVQGDGLYFTTDATKAGRYASIKGGDGASFRIVLSQDAKVFELPEDSTFKNTKLYALQMAKDEGLDEYMRSASGEYSNGMVSAYLRTKGYDAIRIHRKDEDYIVVLNREVMIVDGGE